jgi:hypothetical protein
MGDGCTAVDGGEEYLKLDAVVDSADKQFPYDEPAPGGVWKEIAKFAGLIAFRCFRLSFTSSLKAFNTFLSLSPPSIHSGLGPNP